MRSLPLFIAIKYLRGKRTGFLSFVSSIGFIGVALGVAVLILVSSVMNGFERELRERILQAIPHASINGGVGSEQISLVRDILEENPEVIASSPYIETQGLIGSTNSLKGIYIFGVNPLLEQNQVASFPIHEYWIDIGKMEDFQQAHGEYEAVFGK